MIAELEKNGVVIGDQIEFNADQRDEWGRMGVMVLHGSTSVRGRMGVMRPMGAFGSLSRVPWCSRLPSTGRSAEAKFDNELVKCEKSRSTCRTDGPLFDKTVSQASQSGRDRLGSPAPNQSNRKTHENEIHGTDQSQQGHRGGPSPGREAP